MKKEDVVLIAAPATTCLLLLSFWGWAYVALNYSYVFLGLAVPRLFDAFFVPVIMLGGILLLQHKPLPTPFAFLAVLWGMASFVMLPFPLVGWRVLFNVPVAGVFVLFFFSLRRGSPSTPLVSMLASLSVGFATAFRAGGLWGLTQIVFFVFVATVWLLIKPYPKPHLYVYRA